MLRLFIFRFWPVLIPLIAYVLWMHYVGRRATIAGRPVLRFRDGPWYWAVLASLLIAVGCFVVLAAAQPDRKGDYIPSHIENGTVIPSQVQP